MTYQEFSDTFLPKLATSYLNKEIDFHALIDFELWKKIFPDNELQMDQVNWNGIQFNAFSLDDDKHSLLLVYTIPTHNKKNEAKFIAFRFDNNRNKLLLYSLRRPKYYDELWNIFQYDFKLGKDVYLMKNLGTDSLREFKASIEQIEFQEKTSFFDKIKTTLLFL